MLKIILFCFLFAAVSGHRSRLENDGDMQSALMPQELNPAFVPGKEPMRAVLPFARIRRNTEMVAEPGMETISVAEQVKKYSRIVAAVVLALSAAIEIILYVIEVYSAT